MQVLRMTVNDDIYPPLFYTITGKSSTMKVEVRSILYGYLNHQANEIYYQEYDANKNRDRLFSYRCIQKRHTQ